MNLIQLFAEEEEKIGNEWATCYGIHKSLEMIFKDRAHIIDPSLSSIESPADSNVGVENYIEKIQLAINSGGRELKKPVIVIWGNHSAILDQTSTDQSLNNENPIVRTHWQTLVILAKIIF